MACIDPFTSVKCILKRVHQGREIHFVLCYLIFRVLSDISSIVATSDCYGITISNQSHTGIYEVRNGQSAHTWTYSIPGRCRPLLCPSLTPSEKQHMQHIDQRHMKV